MPHSIPSSTDRACRQSIFRRCGIITRQFALSQDLQPFHVAVLWTIVAISASANQFYYLTHSLTGTLTALLDHVSCVVKRAAVKQTYRVYAWSIIATMAYMRRWLFTRCDKVRQSMGFIWMAFNSKLSIASITNCPFPLPARAVRALAGSLVNVRPKTLYILLAELWNSTIMIRHRSEASFQVEVSR